MSDSYLTVVAAGLAATYVFFWALLHSTQDAKEPPSIEGWIPFLSPVLQMTRQRSNIYRYLRDKHDLPIYTLRLPGSRLYIVNDTRLIPVVQKQVRALSFAPLLVRVFSHFMGFSPAALSIAGADAVEHHGFVHQMTVQTGQALAPGPNLDALNAKAVSILNASLSALSAKEAPTVVKLFEWASHEIMMATTDAIYGPRNPFRDPAVREAYYKLEGGLLTLITGFLPSLLARESLQAREVLTEAFLEYYASGGLDEGASAYARDRYEYPTSLGVPIRDIARMEAGGSIGLVSNTMPATFWTLWHAFSSPAVLADCRGELLAQAVETKDGRRDLDLARIKSACPVLVSTMREAFRLHSVGVSARAVTEDHLLGGRYLLKNSASAWGLDVDDFQHARFVQPAGRKAASNPVAFRAFGGGATLCPGRHFASTEILAFAAVILLRFDAAPLSGSSWNTRGYREANAAFRLPRRDLEVRLTPRDQGDETAWHVYFSEPGRAVAVSAEDEDASAGREV
ncbi:hypothetical protein KJ359_002556 [Pestalotiopsis sp. 9143b]|nr:hypothetical protein KJ359_002556 [Pestalotiopsis sp. 9143b]